MNDILNKISAIGIVPVVKIDNAGDAVNLAKALLSGGLPCMEVTFRTPAAKESIKIISENFPEMLVGAGTVLTIEQVNEAIEAGAKFIVSPALNPEVVKYCIDKGTSILPGCSNPGDVDKAAGFGLDVVKFFPAEASGGINMIKAISGPYSNMRFIPTGGINEKNLNDYLSFNKVIACGGSWMVNEKLINEGRFDEITALTSQAIKQMLGFELAHIGINTNGGEEADNIAGAFSKLFSLEKRDGATSVFAGTAVEVMKGRGWGSKGHIAFKTNYLHRAINYLESRGYEFNEQSKKYDEKGNLAAIYLKGEIAGFAVHIVPKG